MCPHRDHTVYLGGGVSAASAIMTMRKDVRTIAKRKILYREGDQWDEFYNLYSGWAFNYRITSDGRRQIFDILIPGDPINMSALRLDRAPFSVQALTDLIVCVFDRQTLDAHLHDEIQRFKPNLIVSIHAPYGVLDFDGPALPPRRLGRLILDQVGIFPGSLGHYGGVHKGMPVVTIELPSALLTPRNVEIERMWRDLRLWMGETMAQAESPEPTPSVVQQALR